MQSGTTVAVRLGDALRKEAVRLRVPKDILDDLQDAIDALIVHVLRNGSSQADKAETSRLCDAVAGTMSIASGVAWEMMMRAEVRENGDPS